jgi:uncharacterized protein with von Willebrand factor type A (vWA) domain
VRTRTVFSAFAATGSRFTANQLAPVSQVYRYTTRLAHHIGTAEHVSRRRALQASKLALLRAAHPHIRMWVDLVHFYAFPTT